MLSVVSKAMGKIVVDMIRIGVETAPQKYVLWRHSNWSAVIASGMCLGSNEFRWDENDDMRERFIIVELNVECSLFCETCSLE